MPCLPSSVHWILTRRILRHMPSKKRLWPTSLLREEHWGIVNRCLQLGDVVGQHHFSSAPAFNYSGWPSVVPVRGCPSCDQGYRSMQRSHWKAWGWRYCVSMLHAEPIATALRVSCSLCWPARWRRAPLLEHISLATSALYIL